MKHTLMLLVALLLVVAPAFGQETRLTALNCLSEQEQKEGFELLFDGSTISPEIWQNVDRYTVESDGAIVCKPGGNLLTKKEYTNFIFRFEYQLPPGGNNGVGIRVGTGGSPSHETGMELQLLDHFDKKYEGWLKVWQHNGSLYGIMPANRFPGKNDYLKPVGEWNQEEVLVAGTKVQVILNGGMILDADLAECREKPTLDGEPHKGMFRESGFVGFLGHNDPVKFRNIRIRELNEDEAKGSYVLELKFQK